MEMKMKGKMDREGKAEHTTKHELFPEKYLNDPDHVFAS
jgi:hypothetical protein